MDMLSARVPRSLDYPTIILSPR